MGGRAQVSSQLYQPCNRFASRFRSLCQEVCDACSLLLPLFLLKELPYDRAALELLHSFVSKRHTLWALRAILDTDQGAVLRYLFTPFTLIDQLLMLRSPHLGTRYRKWRTISIGRSS